MKMNCWLTLGVMIAASAVAQDNNTNALPPIPAPSPAVAPAPSAPEPAVAPAPATPAPTPAKPKAKKHKAAPVRPINEPTVSLVPGPAQVAVKTVNVRGQAGLKGEVVAHLAQGDTVTVISQINLDKHKANEPAQWAKIALPSSTHVWVNKKFIDAASKTVKVKKLNLRAGPGENYSVLGVIEHGAAINEITAKGNWIQIEPPQDAYAFVAAMYLKQEAAAVAAAAPVPAPTPEAVPAPTPMPEPQPVMTPPAPPAEPAVPPTRVVSHEGVVRGVGSLVAPTSYELYDPATDINIDYLYTSSTNLDLSRYNNMRIIVTGEEALDSRWKDTPIINIQSIQVINTNAVPRVIYKSPRQSQRH